jgi:hypothetical protein
MSAKLWIGVALFLATIASVSGREPDVHIDPTVWNPGPTFWAIPFVFEDSKLDCPEDRWTMTVSNGLLGIHHLNVPPIEPSTDRMRVDPSDDLTYRLEYFRLNCRVDIDIRQQVRSGGEWKSLLVPEARRPSLSKEARQEAIRRSLDALGLPTTDAKRLTQSDIDRINEKFKPKGPPRWTASTMTWRFPFDAAPRSCMEVMGEYRITKNSFALAFFAPLAGELNRVVMDGADLDEAHAQIYLTHDDCRFEFTISQSAVRDGQSVPIPLRPVPNTGNTPLLRIETRD